MIRQRLAAVLPRLLGHGQRDDLVDAEDDAGHHHDEREREDSGVVVCVPVRPLVLRHDRRLGRARRDEDEHPDRVADRRDEEARLGEDRRGQPDRGDRPDDEGDLLHHLLEGHRRVQPARVVGEDVRPPGAIIVRDAQKQDQMKKGTATRRCP